MTKQIQALVNSQVLRHKTCMSAHSVLISAVKGTHSSCSLPFRRYLKQVHIIFTSIHVSIVVGIYANKRQQEKSWSVQKTHSVSLCWSFQYICCILLCLYFSAVFLLPSMVCILVTSFTSCFLTCLFFFYFLSLLSLFSVSAQLFPPNHILCRSSFVFIGCWVFHLFDRLHLFPMFHLNFIILHKKICYWHLIILLSIHPSIRYAHV